MTKSKLQTLKQKLDFWCKDGYHIEEQDDGTVKIICCDWEAEDIESAIEEADCEITRDDEYETDDNLMVVYYVR